MRQVWRLHVRPKGGDADADKSVAYCMANGIVGMGWGLPPELGHKSDDFDWYAAAATQHHTSAWNSVRLFAREARVGDLVWFRDTKGVYYIAELLTDWMYRASGTQAVAADIFNVRQARIIEVGIADAVPGKILSNFVQGTTFRRIRSPGMLAFSEDIAGLPLSRPIGGDAFEFMSAEDLEDVVFTYLQVAGWYVVPASRRTDTAHYEFVLVNRLGGERALVQVKSGKTCISASAYKGPLKTFLYAACGKYGSDIPCNVSLITRAELDAFMEAHPQLLTHSAKRWLAMASSGGIARPEAKRATQ